MANSTAQDQKVLVVDFGAQYGQLIARRVRDLGVYSEIVSCDASADEMKAANPSAIILSGGPASVYADDAPSVDPKVFELGVPVLGFCYGQQIMAVTLGERSATPTRASTGIPTSRELAHRSCSTARPTSRRCGCATAMRSPRYPRGSSLLLRRQTARSPRWKTPSASFLRRRNPSRPEVRHTKNGKRMLENFLFDICGLQATWKMDNIVEQKVAEIREKVGDKRRHLGAFRRRGLLGCRRAVRKGDRQAAHLRLRQPWASSKGRARAG